MNQLERQAIEKVREKEVLKRATIRLKRKGSLDYEILSYVIDKVFILGHNAGHCRGELYRARTRSS